ncbi:lipase maturation factor [Nitzschia inconspicua]|uniref:Lipase maturation factor 2 n=1 Tax=Nitzschia inconspicua TaxID=303405 RepID=A0A9K3L1S3_9STRA|nr:lipase maturation factor [Nitzschia inconspicua]
MTKFTASPTAAPPFHHRAFFLQSLGAIHVIAFWSYYVQFPGLLSSSGIEPVQRSFPYTVPWLYQRLIASGTIDEDALCELFALTGMGIGALIATGVCEHGLSLGIIAAIYSVLVRTGGLFYHFQWDTLLLETTAIACLTYAPWTRLRSSLDKLSSPIAPIPLRFLLFKLMYMSGVVKLQARCPTWENLTALEYHFATQCLPGPLAWYAHQLPPILLRLGVALTLWIEIPAAVLLLLPLKRIRRYSVILQVALQVMIICTGNYNFFNLLTIALCIPVWEGNTETDIPLRPALQSAILSVFTIASASSMFRIERAQQDQRWNIVLFRDSNWLQPQLLLPHIPYCTILLLGGLTVSFLRSKSVTRVLHAIVCMLVIGMMAVPFSQISPNSYSYFYSTFGSLVTNHAKPYLLVNGYGLFRRMTGVGQVPYGARPGWAGLSPSIVERPEIALEGVYISTDETTESWEELTVFRWKPGKVSDMPWQVAPHQPRLDWQMWFAALGNIDHNPWLVSFLQKLIDGCRPVLDLVGAEYPGKKLKKVRAKLYYIDFTRMNTTWARTIPGAEILSDNASVFPSIVWARKRRREYLRPVSEAELSEYLSSQGYSLFCKNTTNPCDHIKTPRFWCIAAHVIRASTVYFLFPLGVVLAFLIRLTPQRKVPLAWTTRKISKSKKD